MAVWTDRDHEWMQQAITLAEEAAAQGEVPVGAIVVLNDQIVGQGFNRNISHLDPTAHAEVVALRAAATAVGNYRLLNTSLYVTLEPCLMCAHAMVHARIDRLVFGAFDPKAGAVVTKAKVLDLPFLNHRVQYDGGLLATQCGHLLSQFFAARRS